MKKDSEIDKFEICEKCKFIFPSTTKLKDFCEHLCIDIKKSKHRYYFHQATETSYQFVDFKNLTFMANHRVNLASCQYSWEKIDEISLEEIQLFKLYKKLNEI